MLGSWKTRLFSWLLGGSWSSAVSLRRGPMELYTFWKEMALTWTLLENDRKWTIDYWFSLSSFLVGRTPYDSFAEFLLISDWRIRHSQIIPKVVPPDLEWIFCLPPFFWLTVVRKSRPVGWYKNLSWAAGMVFMHDYKSSFGTTCQYISIFQFGCSFLENPEHHACKLASPYISWFMFQYFHHAQHLMTANGGRKHNIQQCAFMLIVLIYMINWCVFLDPAKFA